MKSERRMAGEKEVRNRSGWGFIGDNTAVSQLIYEAFSFWACYDGVRQAVPYVSAPDEKVVLSLTAVMFY